MNVTYDWYSVINCVFVKSTKPLGSGQSHYLHQPSTLISIILILALPLALPELSICWVKAIQYWALIIFSSSLETSTLFLSTSTFPSSASLPTFAERLLHLCRGLNVETSLVLISKLLICKLMYTCSPHRF